MPTYTDIDLNLTKKRNGDIQEFTSVDAIKSSIDNIIATLKGSRRMLPEFAGNLWEMLFEPMDEVTAYQIGEELLGAIEQWDSRVIVTNIHVNPRYEHNRYDITVNFRLRNSRQNEQYQLDTILVRG